MSGIDGKPYAPGFTTTPLPRAEESGVDDDTAGFAFQSTPHAGLVEGVPAFDFFRDINGSNAGQSAASFLGRWSPPFAVRAVAIGPHSLVESIRLRPQAGRYAGYSLTVSLGQPIVADLGEGPFDVFAGDFFNGIDYPGQTSPVNYGALFPGDPMVPMAMTALKNDSNSGASIRYNILELVGWSFVPQVIPDKRAPLHFAYRTPSLSSVQFGFFHGRRRLRLYIENGNAATQAPTISAVEFRFGQLSAMPLHYPSTTPFAAAALATGQAMMLDMVPGAPFLEGVPTAILISFGAPGFAVEAHAWD